MAFENDTPIGWCNAGDMKRYPISHHQAVPDFARENACGRTLSIVCFAIAPEYRGQGVASALLERVIADAISQGFAAVDYETQWRVAYIRERQKYRGIPFFN